MPLARASSERGQLLTPSRGELLAAHVVRGKRRDHCLRSLVVKCAGIALELGGETEDEGVVELVGDPAAIDSADGPVSGE
jgi:hypothetical protein